MPGHTCYHCKQFVEEGEAHDCWTTTEDALLEGAADDLREAKGTVRALDGFVAPRCGECRAQRALVFDADAGGGFSGGPVADARTGAVLGITFGYLDGKGDEGRRMYAYDIDLVRAEMRYLLDGGPRP
jgi:hypothetical protein